MCKRLGRVLGFQALLAVVVAASACNQSKNNDAVDQGSNNGGGPAPAWPEEDRVDRVDPSAKSWPKSEGGRSR